MDLRQPDQQAFLLSLCQTVYFSGKLDRRPGHGLRHVCGASLWLAYEAHNLKYGRFLSISLAGEGWVQGIALEPGEKMIVEDTRHARQDGAKVPFGEGGYWLCAPAFGAGAVLQAIKNARRAPAFAKPAGLKEDDWAIDHAAIWLMQSFTLRTPGDFPKVTLLPLLGDKEAAKKDLTLARMFL